MPMVWNSIAWMMAMFAGAFAGQPVAALILPDEVPPAADCGCEATSTATHSSNLTGWGFDGTQAKNGTCQNNAQHDCVIKVSACDDMPSFWFTTPTGIGWIQADVNLPIAIDPYDVTTHPYYLIAAQCGTTTTKKRYLYNAQSDYDPDDPAAGSVGWIEFQLQCESCGSGPIP